jgi:F-type H+-transporting ATPase subunit b
MSGIRVVAGVMLGLVLAVWWPASSSAAEEGDAAHAAPSAGQHGDSSGSEGSPEAAGAHGSHGEVNQDPLEFKTDLAIWTAVVFLVLLVLLRLGAWGRIADGLDKREQRIADEIAGAEKTNADAREILAEYQTKLASAGEEIRQMIDGAKRDAEKVGQGIVDKARAEAEAEHRRKLEEIDLATAGALKDLAERSATLAVELAGKIVQARLDPAAHSRLIEQAVSRFSATEPGNN